MSANACCATPTSGALAAQVRELREALHGYAQFTQMAARESSREIDRLNAEVRGLAEAIDDLRDSVPSGVSESA